MLDKNGKEITEESIREAFKGLEFPGIIDHGDGWFTIKTGESTKKGVRSVNVITNRAGVDLFFKALKEHYNDEKGDI